MTERAGSLRIDLVRPPAEGADLRFLERLLFDVDREFVPPLSAREDTTTKQLSGVGPSRAGPRTYVDIVRRQMNLVGRVGATPVALMSFRVAHHDPAIAGCCPCSYVSTVAVDAAQRRGGIARALYAHLLTELPPAVASPFVATRTWSGNSAHIRLLDDLGFAEVLRVTDDRGPGIDTVYLARRVP